MSASQPETTVPQRGDDPVIYKILRLSEWQVLDGTGCFDGSADDKRDGFVHMSTPAQVPSTVAKYYTRAQTGGEDIVLAAVRADAVDAKLIYEPARIDEFFPHIYGPLMRAAVTDHAVLSVSADGTYDASAFIARSGEAQA